MTPRFEVPTPNDHHYKGRIADRSDIPNRSRGSPSPLSAGQLTDQLT
jgi:hypothetical protein